VKSLKPTFRSSNSDLEVRIPKRQVGADRNSEIQKYYPSGFRDPGEHSSSPAANFKNGSMNSEFENPINYGEPKNKLRDAYISNDEVNNKLLEITFSLNYFDQSSL